MTVRRPPSLILPHSMGEGGAVPREAYLVIRARLARLARKAGRVGSFIFASRACRARLACLAHYSHARSAYPRLQQKLHEECGSGEKRGSWPDCAPPSPGGTKKGTATFLECFVVGRVGARWTSYRRPMRSGPATLARIIHDGSSPNRAVAKRDRRAEPRGREASLNRMLTD